MTRVVLLTDFGTADGYAAAVAAVIASAAPEALVEHATHDIPPGDILAAAFTLARYAGLYPEGTVHLAVVDPGVGTQRREVAAAVDGRFFVGPDNGLFTRVLHGASRARIVALERVPADAAPTFHGRDVFGPAAARLARGEALDSLGSPVTDPVLLPIPDPVPFPGGSRGEVVQVDRFGTLITNVPGSCLDDAGGRGEVRVSGRSVGPVRRTYGDVAEGALIALVGSLGLLEVSVRDGSAADRLGVTRGAPVEIRF
jgi:S-adenosyl-L-methionine hydrolase (adenosine-forming)